MKPGALWRAWLVLSLLWAAFCLIPEAVNGPTPSPGYVLTALLPLAAGFVARYLWRFIKTGELRRK